MSLLGTALFFLSGFAALLYQVIWQRLLVIFSGADVYSATIVVAAFMAGLGCGSLIGGILADRLRAVAAMGLFAAAELGIALFGFGSRWILYDGLYERLGHVAAHPSLMAGLLFVTLLWPTLLMGVSLPLLARALTRSVDTAARTIGALYAFNTLGAALGAFCAIWWFMPRQGLEGGLAFAGTLNLTCAVLALPLIGLLRWKSSRPSWAAVATRGASVSASPGAPPPSMPFGYPAWVGLFAISGFVALSVEIVWFRLLGVTLKSTAFTFGTLLAQYLFWLGAGSAVGSLAARRIRHPAQTFLAVQAAAGLYAGLGLTALLAWIGRAPALDWVRVYLAGYEPMAVAPATASLRAFVNDLIWHTPDASTLPFEFLFMYFALPALLIGPATLLMGFAFPLLQRVVQTDLVHLGSRVGTLLLANIAGATAGTILTGWGFLTWFGTGGTIRLLVGTSAAFALCLASLARPGRRRHLRYGVAVVLFVSAIAAVPDSEALWSRLHGRTAGAMAFGEDASGLAVLKSSGPTLRDGVEVYVNGIGQSRLPFGPGIQTLLGALPAMIHPDPREAAVVGLGSGNTLAALAGRQQLQRITSIEIVEPLTAVLRDSTRAIGYTGVDLLFSDPRIEHVTGDGRLFLRQAGRRFDIIEADALRPSSAYSGSLYSVEYFEILRAHLQPQGLAVTWSPTDRVARTFASVFPHAVQYGAVLLGSNEPILIDREAVSRRLADADTRRYYAALGVDLTAMLIPLIWNPVVLEPRQADDVNTDLFPRDEFNVPVVFDFSMLRPEGLR